MADADDTTTDETAQDAEVDATDETTEPADQAHAPQSNDTDEPSDDETWDPERYKAAMRKKNRENESLRKRLKDAEPALAEYQKLVDAKKTDQERLEGRAAEAERRFADIQRDYNHLVIKTEFGLTDAQVKRLSGDTLDELREDAEAFVAEVGLTKKDGDADTAGGKPAPRKTQPKADALKGGLRPGPKDDDGIDPAKLAEKIYKSGLI